MDELKLIADSGVAIGALLVLFYFIRNNKAKVEEIGTNHLEHVNDSLIRLDESIKELTECVRANKDILIEIRAKLNGYKK